MSYSSYMGGTTAKLSIHSATSLKITKRSDISEGTGKPYTVFNISCGNNGCDILTHDISIFMDSDAPVTIQDGVFDNE